MKQTSSIYVAGGTTLIGAALHSRLAALGYANVVAAHDEPAYDNMDAVRQFFDRVRPEYVFVAAGRTAGIAGNQRAPADLMLDNLRVATHLIPAAWEAGTTKLLYL
ncbi:MAG: NAD-dependent epimerase/dehydratase family protein, partial [Acidobacteria bacterium]|nr:NAD-dependent epimerase/dehydratase family protein [Acidobacteriota bacterium]